MDIKWLVAQAQLGDKEALLSLIMAEKDRYYRLAYRYVGNSEDAMDALEDMIVIIYEKIGQLKNEEAFYSWSKTILVNQCKALIKMRKRHIPFNEWHEVWDQLLMENKTTLHSQEQRIVLEEQLLKLSEEQRETLSLKYWHDLDHANIARILNIPVGTVKSRLHQGLKKLRNNLGRESDYES